MKKTLSILLTALFLSAPIFTTRAFVVDNHVRFILNQDHFLEEDLAESAVYTKVLLKQCPKLKTYIYHKKDISFGFDFVDKKRGSWFTYAEKINEMGIKKLFSMGLFINSDYLRSLDAAQIPFKEALTKPANLKFIDATFYIALEPQAILITTIGLGQFLCDAPISPKAFDQDYEGKVMYSIPFDRDEKGVVVPLMEKITSE